MSHRRLFRLLVVAHLRRYLWRDGVRVRSAGTVTAWFVALAAASGAAAVWIARNDVVESLPVPPAIAAVILPMMVFLGAAALVVILVAPFVASRSGGALAGLALPPRARAMAAEAPVFAVMAVAWAALLPAATVALDALTDYGAVHGVVTVTLAYASGAASGRVMIGVADLAFGRTRRLQSWIVPAASVLWIGHLAASLLASRWLASAGLEASSLLPWSALGWTPAAAQALEPGAGPLLAGGGTLVVLMAGSWCLALRAQQRAPVAPVTPVRVPFHADRPLPLAWLESTRLLRNRHVLGWVASCVMLALGLVVGLVLTDPELRPSLVASSLLALAQISAYPALLQPSLGRHGASLARQLGIPATRWVVGGWMAAGAVTLPVMVIVGVACWLVTADPAWVGVAIGSQVLFASLGTVVGQALRPHPDRPSSELVAGGAVFLLAVAINNVVDRVIADPTPLQLTVALLPMVPVAVGLAALLVDRRWRAVAPPRPVEGLVPATPGLAAPPG